jgi:hypothetical protein
MSSMMAVAIMMTVTVASCAIATTCPSGAAASTSAG